MIASLLMRYKSRDVNADNKGDSGRCPQVAPEVAASYTDTEFFLENILGNIGHPLGTIQYILFIQ
jgi:hypothetical protein